MAENVGIAVKRDTGPETADNHARREKEVDPTEEKRRPWER